MSEFDWLDLDARLLRLLVTVVDTGAITTAAQRLGVTQSAVSHLLDKLRRITGDALFTKAGRGIAPTARALALAERARTLLGDLERFAEPEHFDPARWTVHFTVAANDFQRDALLRQQHCQLVISPRPPEGADLVQKRLFTDHYRVFYDSAVRAAPRTRRDYLAAEHVSVLYTPNRPLDLDRVLQAKGVERRFRVMVPGFAGLSSFVRGTDLLATAPGLLSTHLLQGLAHAEVPVPCPSLPMYMVWHQRHQQDAAHRWLRGELAAVARALFPTD